ncbi:MAG: T9SS type A sorting domain-containing protein [Bacteroidetes bacterium]|nr:T9SS type A sorting domain-containing protein [Bacteroidota bacterium]
MKAIFTLVLLALFGSAAQACSFITTPFCERGNASNNTIIYGKVADTIPHGIKLEVFHVYRGTIMNDTITIWDSKFWCMDTTQLPARQIGNIGDTVIVDVPYVDSIANPWEVIGDYRMDNFYAHAMILSVQGDSVFGFVSGYPSAPPQYQKYVYGLEAFRAWLETDEDCNTLVSVKEPSFLDILSIYPNPSTEHITISNLPLNASVELINLSGQTINTFDAGTSHISTAHLAAGTYLLKINYQGETGFRRIVKL